MMQCLRAGRNLMLTSANQSWELFANAYNSKPSNQNVCRKKNILSLAIFVRLEGVFKLRACCLTSKLDPSVIVSLEE